MSVEAEVSTDKPKMRDDLCMDGDSMTDQNAEVLSRTCMKCGNDEARSDLHYKGQHFCERCAHNFTRNRALCHDELPCPFTDGNTGELIPYGVYPNIDWS